MRCLSAFASFERYTHIDTEIQTQTHTQIHFAKWENVSVAPSCGNSCCSQQKARPNDDDDNNPQSTLLQPSRASERLVSCISQIRMPLVRCLSLTEFSLPSFYFFLFCFLLLHFILLCPLPLRVSCGCVAHDKRSINSKVGASPRLDSPAEATCCVPQHCYVPHL